MVAYTELQDIIMTGLYKCMAVVKAAIKINLHFNMAH